MNTNNIEKKARKQGHKISFDKFVYWDNILHINGMAIADTNSRGVETDFKYKEVEKALKGNYSSMSEYICHYE